VSTVYAGIDVGKRKHEVTYIDTAGQQLGKSLVFDNSPQGIKMVLDRSATLEADEVVYGLEATGHYWLPLYAALTASGSAVKVINPLQPDSLRNMYIRVTKNDRKDSFLVAEVLRFGRYTETKVADEPIVQLRELSRMRVEFVESVGGIKQRILGILDRIFPEFESCFSSGLGRTAIEILQAYPDPEDLAHCDLDELTRLLQECSRGKFARDKANQLKNCAANTFGTRFGIDAFVLQLKLLLDQLNFIMDQVKQIDRAISELMQEHQLILTIPGIGPVLGAAILGEIGDISRFDSPKKLRAYAGLDASVYQSGNFRASMARISKRGSPYLRRAFWMAAQVARMYDPNCREFYQRLRDRGKHPKQAQAAVASKLCGIVYAVLSKNQAYDPNFNASFDKKSLDLS